MNIKDIPILELESYFRMVQSMIDSIMRTNPTTTESIRTAQISLNKYNRIKTMLLKEILSRLEEITDQTTN